MVLTVVTVVAGWAVPGPDGKKDGAYEAESREIRRDTQIYFLKTLSYRCLCYCRPAQLMSRRRSVAGLLCYCGLLWLPGGNPQGLGSGSLASLQQSTSTPRRRRIVSVSHLYPTTTRGEIVDLAGLEGGEEVAPGLLSGGWRTGISSGLRSSGGPEICLGGGSVFILSSCWPVLPSVE